MQKIGYKKIFSVLGVLVLLTAGFFGLSLVTAQKACAQCTCGDLCIDMVDGIDLELGVLYGEEATSDLAPAYVEVGAELTLQLASLTSGLAIEINQVKTDMTGWWGTFWDYNLGPTLKLIARELGAAVADQTKQLGAFQSAMDVTRSQLNSAEDQVHSIRAHRVSDNSCVSATASGTMAKVTALQTSYSAAAPAEKMPRTANSTDAGAKGTALDMQDRWAGYVKNYCDPDANAGNPGCTTVGGYGKNADLDVAGQIFNKDTIDITDPQTKQIVDDLIANISEPFVRDPVPASAVKTTAGQEQMLNNQAYRAKRQVIYDALYQVVGRRAPGGKGGDINRIGEIRQAAGVDPALISPNPSHAEIMQAMMSDRWRSGAVGVDQIDEPENNARMLVEQEAYQAMQWSDELDLLDRYSLLLAAEASTEVQARKPEAATNNTKAVK